MIIIFSCLQLDDVKLAFKLMEDAGIPQERAKPEGRTNKIGMVQSYYVHTIIIVHATDIVHKDLKNTLRVLYSYLWQVQVTFPATATTTTPTSQGNASAV